MTRPDWTDCDHEQTEIRAMTQSNGCVVHVRQCLRCGANRGCVKKTAAQRPLLDVELRDGWQERVAAYYEERRVAFERELGTRVQARQTEQAAFWRKYNEYLRGPVWRSKASRVLRRDGYICQACLGRPATQAHHLSYAHVFDEPLFELTSVCDVCHKEITKSDRERRGDPASAA